MKRGRLSWVLLLVGASGCGAAGLERSFEPGWLWDQGLSGRAILERTRGKTAAPAPSVAVGVTGPGLSGRVLPDGLLWTYEGGVDVLPSIASDLVAFSGDNYVTGLDASTGKQRFRIDAGGRRLEGLGYDGKTAVLLLVDEDDARPDLIAVVGESGQLRYSTTTLEHVGTPAAFAGLGFVPWSNQYVSAFDLATGESVGRLLVRDATHRVEARETGLLFFGQGVVALSEELTRNPDLPSLRLPKQKLPGNPSWPVDGSKPRPVRAQSSNITTHVELSGQAIAFAADAYAFSYFDIAVGLEAASGAVRWAAHFERSIVGSETGSDALGVCLEDGTLATIDLRDGRNKPLGALESRLRACVISDVPSFGGGSGTPATDQQILDAVTQTGANMAAMHAWLVEELGRRPGSPATAALLEIAQDPLTSTSVVERAGRALAERSEGADAMIRALLESAPPLPAPSAPAADPKTAPKTPPTKTPLPAAPTPPPATTPGPVVETPPPVVDPAVRRSTKRQPPLIALSRALASMGDKRAATPLARHLLAPSISTEQASALVDAVLSLGGPAECPLLFEFFATYRAAGGEPEFLAALARAATFVKQHGSAAEKAAIEKASTDSVTHPDLRKLLEAAAAPSAARKAAPRPQEEPKAADKPAKK